MTSPFPRNESVGAAFHAASDGASTQALHSVRKLLTKKELAIRYSVVPRTIDNWMAQRQIPFLKLGRKLIRFDPDECDRALQQFKVEATRR